MSGRRELTRWGHRRRRAASEALWWTTAALPRRPRDLLRYAGAVAELSQWVREHPAPVVFGTRRSLHEAMHAEVGGGRVDYLEFGVANGMSIRYWLEANTHPGSRFVGFDSFEGLPQEWWDASRLITRPPGTFRRNGQPPDIADPRVQFVKGWFQDTLGPFLERFVPETPLVVHYDCDLYSSTLYGLTMLDRVARAGTVVIFDEFNSPAHEFRAFMDYTNAFRRGYRLLGVVQRRPYRQVAIRLE
jgi:hypothetical protein